MGKVYLNSLISHSTTLGRAVRADATTAFALMEVNSGAGAAHRVKSCRDKGRGMLTWKNLPASFYTPLSGELKQKSAEVNR